MDTAALPVRYIVDDGRARGKCNANTKPGLPSTVSVVRDIALPLCHTGICTSLTPVYAYVMALLRARRQSMRCCPCLHHDPWVARPPPPPLSKPFSVQGRVEE